MHQSASFIPRNGCTTADATVAHAETSAFFHSRVLQHGLTSESSSEDWPGWSLAIWECSLSESGWKGAQTHEGTPFEVQCNPSYTDSFDLLGVLPRVSNEAFVDQPLWIHCTSRLCFRPACQHETLPFVPLSPAQGFRLLLHVQVVAHHCTSKHPDPEHPSILKAATCPRA